MSNLPNLIQKTLALASRCGTEEDKRLVPQYRAELEAIAARLEPVAAGEVLAVSFAQGKPQPEGGK